MILLMRFVELIDKSAELQEPSRNYDLHPHLFSVSNNKPSPKEHQKSEEKIESVSRNF